jgi:hypothetical protein
VSAGVAERPASGVSSSPRFPPFEVANLLAARHGAYSERLISPAADAIRDWLVGEVPRLAAARYAPAVRRYAWLEAQLLAVEEWLDGRPVVDESGAPAGAFDLQMRLVHQVAKQAERLGLDPVSETRLAREAAQATYTDLAAAEQRGRQEREKRAASRILDGEAAGAPAGDVP